MEDAGVGLAVDHRGEGTRAAPLSIDGLCQAYAARVYKFARLISNDSATAEDLAQDALERAIRGLQTFDASKGDIEGWLWRIVVNAGRDAGRIAGRQRLVFQLLADRWPLEQQSADLRDELRTDEVLEAVRALSSRHRVVLSLRFGADLSYRSIGQSLGISEAAALMATRRALANIRARLSQKVDPK